jgi:hypothetical protein
MGWLKNWNESISTERSDKQYVAEPILNVWGDANWRLGRNVVQGDGVRVLSLSGTQGQNVGDLAEAIGRMTRDGYALTSQSATGSSMIGARQRLTVVFTKTA